MPEMKVLSPAEVAIMNAMESQKKKPVSDRELEFFVAIHKELKKAKEKFPVFCDKFTGARESFVLDELDHWRKANSSAPYFADAILNEEILEAISAYQCDDLENCMVELAQCGAVILRMMEYVAKEMK